MVRNVNNTPSKVKKTEGKNSRDVQIGASFAHPDKLRRANNSKDSGWLEFKQIMRVLSILPRRLIVTTPEKMKDLLEKHLKAAAQKRAWIEPFILLTTLIIALGTTEFKDRFLLPGSIWCAVFLVGSVLAVVWLVVSIIIGIAATRRETDLETDIKKESTETSTMGFWILRDGGSQKK